MELKVVINLKEGRGIVGVQQKDTDPVMESFELVGSEVEVWLAGAFAVVRQALEHAREQWAVSPKNPSYQGPPVPPAAPARPTPTSQPVPVRKEARKESKDGQMQRLI